MIYLRIIAVVFLGIWLTLVLLGKSGFVHLLLLSGIGFAVIDAACLFRRRAVR